MLTACWVNDGLARGLAERAGNTGKSEIVGGVGTARCHWHDVIDMEGCFLSQLRQTAELATITSTPHDQPADSSGNVLGQGRTRSGALCPQLQEGQELGQFDEALGFPSLVQAQLLTAVLAIKQNVQAVVHTSRKPEVFQILRQLQLDENLLRHADLSRRFRPDAHSTPLGRRRPSPHLTDQIISLLTSPPWTSSPSPAP